MRLHLVVLSLLGLIPVSCKSTCLTPESGHHHRGDRVAVAGAFYGAPITGKALSWHGLGDVPNYGLSLQNYWFPKDRLALGASLNAIQFKTPGDTITGGEVEGRLRYFLGETEGAGCFLDLCGGYMRTQDQIPPGGTRGNYTFAFGPGVEIPFSPEESLLFGVEFHHMSNALGRESSRNPSQNEFLIWMGLGAGW